MEKIGETTITRIEPQQVRTTPVEKGGAVEGASTFEEFMARQAQLTNIHNKDDLQNYYNTFVGGQVGTTGTGGMEANFLGSVNPTEANLGPEDPSITVANGKASLTDIFKKAAEKYDVPYKLLVSVAKAESNFNEKSVSHSGAMGVMQLMPATAKYLGVKNAYDPEQNIMGGARYLSEKIKEHGDVSLGLAAYNAGSGAVRKYGGIPPYAETQNYVKKVNDYMKGSVDVPDRKFPVTFASSSGTQAASRQTANQQVANPQVANPVSSPTVAAASVQVGDLNQALVTVGSGKDKITLTYEAYQKYLELTEKGVG